LILITWSGPLTEQTSKVVGSGPKVPGGNRRQGRAVTFYLSFAELISQIRDGQKTGTKCTGIGRVERTALSRRKPKHDTVTRLTFGFESCQSPLTLAQFLCTPHAKQTIDVQTKRKPGGAYVLLMFFYLFCKIPLEFRQYRFIGYRSAQ